MDTLKTSFVLKKSKINASGKAPINIRAGVNGKYLELTTKQFVEPAKWNPIKQEVKGNSESSRVLNNYLLDIKNKVVREFNLLLENQPYVTLDALKSVLQGNKERSKSLVEVFEENNALMKKEIGSKYTKNTVDRYKISITRLKEFLKQDISGSTITLDKLDYKFMKRYENFLFTTYHCDHNTVMKYLKHLKKVIHQAMAFGYLNSDPFMGYKTAYKEVNRGYLTQKEIDVIKNKVFRLKRLEEVRDIFIFACYTGISYSDLYALSPDDIQTQIDGSKVIVLERKKTRVRAVIPILDITQQIISQYKNHPLCSVNGTLLPMKVNQKMNAYLHEIEELCEIRKSLTMHLARHTFATTIALSNGVPLETVQKILGHKNIQTTQIYSRTLDTKVVNDMNVLNTKLKGVGNEKVARKAE